MDTLAEELQATGEGFRLSDELIIAVLLWVDDVISCVDGEKEQEEILEKIHEFAVKHRLVWGQSKCKVMRVGKHTGGQREWKLGDIMIEETTTYKYLGDIISNDGKNAKNLESRKNKIQMNTVLINSIAESEVLRRIETSSLLELHEKKNVSGLMANAESWSLNRGETAELERIEVQALKYMFDLPTHTPTPAIIFTLGAMYTKQRIDKKRLMYLHRILNRDSDKWTKQAFFTLQQMNIGWDKSISEALTEYNLPTDLTTIKNTSRRRWKKTIIEKIEIKNASRLHEDCHKKVNNTLVPKTKTAHIIPYLTITDFKRRPQEEIIQCTKYETKTIIIARFGMLACGKNYKGSMSEMCGTCNVIDDENHRLNFCSKYRETNLYDNTEKKDFAKIFSHDIDILRDILPKIQKVWNTKTARGSMVA